MSFVTKRNSLISALHKAVGVPVLLASQVQPEAEPPFIVYSVTADYIPDGGLGNYSLGEGATQDDLVEVREEQPTATLSFTACSVGRTAEGMAALRSSRWTPPEKWRTMGR